MTGASNIMDNTKASKNEMTALPRNAVNCVAEENENDKRVSRILQKILLTTMPCLKCNGASH